MKSFPEPPPWLGRDANREWDKLAVVPSSEEECATLAAYCVVMAAWLRLRAVNSDLQAQKSLGADLSNALTVLEIELGQQVAELAAALGLTAPTSARRPTRVLVLDEGEDGENNESGA